MNDPFVFEPDAVFSVDDYLYFYEETLRSEQTQVQVDRMESELGLTAHSRIVDLGCGHGRHAIEFARRGHSVLGVDMMGGFVARARLDAMAAGVTVDFERGDLRTLNRTEEFDAAVCLFDSFGFHRDEENERVLANMARALRVGGGFCLDIRNRDWLVRNLLPVTVLERNGDVMIDRHVIDSRTGRLVDRRVIVRGGVTREAPFSVRMYTFSELASLLERQKLTVRSVFGDWNGAALSLNHNRMVIFGTRTG
jgi:SAM-dependent methyltransferase